MKKIIALFGFIALSTSVSFAYIYDDATADIDVLKKQGYSTAALELVDKARDLQSGQDGKYQKKFAQKGRTKKGNVYHQVKTYLDPIQDDGKFGVHKIEFSNTWQGDEVFYASPLKEKDTVENL